MTDLINYYKKNYQVNNDAYVERSSPSDSYKSPSSLTALRNNVPLSKYYPKPVSYDGFRI